MNFSLITLETLVGALGLVLLLADLWASPATRRRLGYAAIAGLGVVLFLSYTRWGDPGGPAQAFGGMFVQDGMSLFFKRMFLVAAMVVLLLGVESPDDLAAGPGEYYSLTLFALAGMMLATSANDFSLMFVSIELMTVAFYVLTSFRRTRVSSLEAGVKYLILGALASALLVFGISWLIGATGQMTFPGVSRVVTEQAGNKLILTGVLLVLAGLGFKIAAVPLQWWTPDVYQGAPTPTTAFLAIGSKAAGFALLLRFLGTAVPALDGRLSRLLIWVAAATILYGSLCAIPQRNLKRLMGYSSITNAGFLLVGVAALSPAGTSAVLFYLGGYLFAVLAAFGVITVVFREEQSEDLAALAGLHQRSPFLAATLAVAMVSLAGIPPLVGFFGKFLLIGAAIERGSLDPAYYTLVGVAVVGVVISLYYYLGVVRAIYWGEPITPATPQPLVLSRPLRWALAACLIGMILFGFAPGGLLNLAQSAVIGSLP